MIRVALCGGIGSGKSTAAAVFRELGVPVYISDVRARELMNTSQEIRSAVIAQFGCDTYSKEGLCPKVLSGKVFCNAEALARLNAIVHPLVRRDFRRWCKQHSESEYVVLESAILFESGMRDDVDFVIAILAPENLRIERALRRDSANREEILRRIRAQLSDDELVSKADISLVNIDMEDFRKDILELHAKLKMKSGKGE